MSFITGTGASAQFGKETTFGTEATPTALLDITSEGISVSVEKGDEGSLLASKTAQTRDLMAIKVDGSLSLILRPETAGLLFHAAFGGADAVSEDGEYKKHTINLCGAKADLPSFTLVVDRNASVKKYTGCTVSSLTIEAAAGDYVKCSVDIKGVKEEAGTLNPSIQEFTIPSYRCTSASLRFAGQEYAVTSSTFKLDNSLEDAPQTYKSGLYSGQPKHGRRGASISFEVPYSSEIEALKSAYLVTEETAAIELKFTSSNPGYSVTITLPNVSLTSVDANVGGTGIITASLEGEALSVGSVEPVTAVIRDKNAEAYGG